MKKKHVNSHKKPIRYYAFTFLTVAFLVLMEIAILSVYVIRVSRAVSIVNLALRLLSLLVMLYIVNEKENNAYKLAWCVPILLFPLVGGFAYLIAKTRTIHKKAKNHILSTRIAVKKQIPPTQEITNPTLSDKHNLYRYLVNSDFPAYRAEDIRYYAMGKDMYESLLSDLRNAHHFIFMEYFIIQEGQMWNNIVKILQQKVKEGIEVRLIYDGMGCIRTLPRNYPKKLAEHGIKVKVFSPFVPFITTLQNNRDHRKITVIDGEIAYTGGVNLADEYICKVDRFGVWKDSGIRFTGNSTNSFTRFFLNQWNGLGRVIETDLARYFPCNEMQEKGEIVIPYCVSPLDEHTYAKNVYLKIIHNAKDYLYIMTPYLVPGEDIMEALKLASKSGVDVRLITPSIPDHKLVHLVGQSKYRSLLEAGVRIYEYTPGFIHSKNFVCDDFVTTCGSVNLDYRSLYLHFECGSVVFGNQTALQVKHDFLSTFTECTEITSDTDLKRSIFTRILLTIIRTFEPLL